MELPDKIISFFKKQSFVIVSTIDADGRIHCSAKGIVDVRGSRAFVIDLYCNKTYKNLKNDPRISITQIEEQSFIGYTLSGKAKIVPKNDIYKEHIKEWERRVSKRISNRLIKSVQNEKGSSTHHEAKLPEDPKYLIEINVENIIDLSPPYAKKTEDECPKD